ncbi:hypothetical protein [Methanobacterium spitsbergense]|uniref:Uncharacterized protein n=1 Tax=Methanobacterium spitsbergense TaxID=2874285 RepID=A0A8T5UXN4_9EURY|nr:hypothetical protein [Methanobacterium spitsbergense]MBZ2165459.1 hypothetical protein [Methanobacterium spitsbergense]
MVNLLPVHAVDQVTHKFTYVQVNDHQKTNSNTADISIIHYDDLHYPQGTSKTVSYNNNQQFRYRYTNSSNEINFLKRKPE